MGRMARQKERSRATGTNKTYLPSHPTSSHQQSNEPIKSEPDVKPDSDGGIEYVKNTNNGARNNTAVTNVNATNFENLRYTKKWRLIIRNLPFSVS